MRVPLRFRSAPERPEAPRDGRIESRLIGGGYVLYMCALTAYFALHGQFPTPDLLVVAILPMGLLFRRWNVFAIDWLPFLMLVLAYEQARGLVLRLDPYVHIGGVIWLEEVMFGTPIPTVRLQQWLMRDEIMPWDVAASGLYMLHFVVPIVAALWFWTWSRAVYWRYALGLLLLSYSGFLTYALYPQAPPWLAASWGHMPEVGEIFVRSLQQFTLYQPFHSVYETIDPNPVAAMPSLHAAFPVYTYLAIARMHPGWLAIATVLYPIAVIVAIVYLGHHFVVDCLAGAAYAVACFWVVWDMPDWLRARRARRATRAARGLA